MTTTRMRSGGPGRPSKGDRDQFMTRPARPVGDRVRQEAARLGYDSYSDFIAAVLAEKVGLAELAPAPVHPPMDEELPLQHTA